MAHTQDYIPTRDADFDGWLENLKNYVTAKTSSAGGTPAHGQWTHIPADRVTALTAAYTNWHAAYEKTLGAHTAVEILAQTITEAGNLLVRDFAIAEKMR